MRFGPQKRIAARVLGVGRNKVKFNQDRLEDIKEALTKADIRGLVKEKAVYKSGKNSQSRSKARKRLLQKKKGRQHGHGSREGRIGGRINKKRVWMNKVRSQRKIIKGVKEKNQIKNEDYKQLYSKIKGGFFRSKRHLIMYMEEKNLLKKNDTTKKKKTE
ncbi:MAG: 50S ribosomal protein L19e [Candidatus Nanoarchaeia archaeon]|nr:50S ribosomal protein L19e [Candidatus Nanoarchaeia archaeon]